LLASLREHLLSEHLGGSRVGSAADELATKILAERAYALEYVAVAEDNELVFEPYWVTKDPRALEEQRLSLSEEVYVVRAKQTVSEMVVEVLARQAERLGEQTGRPFGEAYEDVLETEAGRQLAELAEGPHRHERASYWQANLRIERASMKAGHPVSARTSDALELARRG
jgi:hypothetical protein